MKISRKLLLPVVCLLAVGSVTSPASIAAPAEFDTLRISYEYYTLGPGQFPPGRSSDRDTALYCGPLSVWRTGHKTSCLLDSSGHVFQIPGMLPMTVESGDSLVLLFQPGGMPVALDEELTDIAAISVLVYDSHVHIPLMDESLPDAYEHNAHLNVYYHFSRVIDWVRRYDCQTDYVYEPLGAAPYIYINYVNNFWGTRYHTETQPHRFLLRRVDRTAYCSDILYHEFGHRVHFFACNANSFFRDNIRRINQAAGISESICDYLAYSMNHGADSTALLFESLDDAELRIDPNPFIENVDHIDYREFYTSIMARLYHLMGADAANRLVVRVFGESRLFVNRLRQHMTADEVDNYGLTSFDVADWFFRADEAIFQGQYREMLSQLFRETHLLPPQAPAIFVRALAGADQREDESLNRRLKLYFTAPDNNPHFVLQWAFRDAGYYHPANTDTILPWRQRLIYNLATVADSQTVRLSVDDQLTNGVYDGFLHEFGYRPRDPYYHVKDAIDSSRLYLERWVEVTAAEPDTLDHAVILHFPAWLGAEAEFQIKLGSVWCCHREVNWSDSLTCTLYGGVAVSAVDEEAERPGELQLAHNWPNPFNGATQIMFSLPVSGPVQMTVFDVSGRMVWEQHWDRLEAGAHTYVWTPLAGDGCDLASGIYLLRLNTTGGNRAMKMIYAK